MNEETIQPKNPNKDGDEYMPWLDQEIEEMEKNKPKQDYEKLPGLFLEEKKVNKFEIDASKPFESWLDKRKKPATVKKIIPVIQDGENKLWWLSTRNPIYREVIEELKKGRKMFSITRTGKDTETRYTLMEED